MEPRHVWAPARPPSITNSRNPPRGLVDRIRRGSSRKLPDLQRITLPDIQAFQCSRRDFENALAGPFDGGPPRLQAGNKPENAVILIEENRVDRELHEKHVNAETGIDKKPCPARKVFTAEKAFGAVGRFVGDLQILDNDLPGSLIDQFDCAAPNSYAHAGRDQG